MATASYPAVAMTMLPPLGGSTALRKVRASHASARKRAAGRMFYSERGGERDAALQCTASSTRAHLLRAGKDHGVHRVRLGDARGSCVGAPDRHGDDRYFSAAGDDGEGLRKRLLVLRLVSRALAVVDPVVQPQPDEDAESSAAAENDDVARARAFYEHPRTADDAPQVVHPQLEGGSCCPDWVLESETPPSRCPNSQVALPLVRLQILGVPHRVNSVVESRTVSMADAVTAILERMVPELEELQERGIFTPVSGCGRRRL